MADLETSPIPKISASYCLRIIMLNSASLFSVLTSSPSNHPPDWLLMSFAGLASLRDRAPWPSQHGVRRTKPLNLRSVLAAISPSELWKSRTRFIRRPAKDIFPPRAEPYLLLLVGRSGSGLHISSCPVEFGAVAPHTVHDNRQPTSEGDDGLSVATSFCGFHGPGFQP